MSASPTSAKAAAPAQGGAPAAASAQRTPGPAAPNYSWLALAMGGMPGAEMGFPAGLPARLALGGRDTPAERAAQGATAEAPAPPGLRLHQGHHARLAAAALGARAFTFRNHVVLGAGADPGDAGLLAHEAAHTRQQRAAPEPALLQRDATDQSITPGYAAELDDGDLMYQLQAVESLMLATAPEEDSYALLSGNLEVLREEYFGRDPGQYCEDPSLAPAAAAEPLESRAEPVTAIPEGGTDIGAVGIVAWDRSPQLRLRSSPDTAGSDNIVASLPFGTRLQVIKSFPGDWYFVSTPDGGLGYAAAAYIFMDLPEPNARLHRVEAGIPGTAIAIAERYYGEYAHDWGQDLRFYINVLAWANDIAVPEGTAGWRQVHFQAGQLIWVPSQQFAYSLKGAVNSGSISYNIADALGLAEFIERVGQLWADFRRAVELSGQYMWDAIVTRMEETLWAMVEGLATLLLGAVAILAISTAIGAAIGALAGGVGAAPGAAAGFEVGMVIIEWLGLAMLVVWIVQSVVELGAAFGGFLATVWEANGDEQVLDQAAREFAEAIALLLAKIFEALLMLVAAKGLPKGMEALRGTRLGRALGETRAMRWLSERAASIEAGEAPLRSPADVMARIRGTGRPGAEPAGITRNGNHAAFHDLPPDRLPSNLPEGHFWMRSAEGEWVLMREPGASPVEFELSVYADAAGNTNYVLRGDGRLIQSDAVTRTGTTYSGSERLPEALEQTGATNPYRDPVTGEVWDKGHGVDFADTLEGPGVHSSTLDVNNFTPQASWWNQGPRNSLVGRIRNGHAPSGRPGGGGYREMGLYADNPPVTADGTLIPREFIFVETNRAGVAQRAWRIRNQHGAAGRGIAAIDPLEIPLGDVPAVMLRTGMPLRSSGGGTLFAPFIVFGVPGDDERSGAEVATPEAGEMCLEGVPESVDAPWCEAPASP